MRKILLAPIIALLLTSCGAHMYNTTSSGQADQSYIVILSDNKAYDDITIEIDGDQQNIDKVFKVKAARRANPIVVSTGRHSVKVFNGTDIIYESDIFLSVQQTKKIIL